MGTVVQNPIQYVLCAMSCTLCYVFGGSRHYGQQYTRFTITDLVDVRHVHVAVRHARRLVRARLAVAPCPSWLTPRRLQTNFNQTGKNQNRASWTEKPCEKLASYSRARNSNGSKNRILDNQGVDNARKEESG